MSKELHYLNKQVREQEKELEERLRNKTITPINHALQMDMLRFFKARIKVAKLIGKDDK